MALTVLNELAFANSLAVLTAALYMLFAIIALVSPSAFQFLGLRGSEWVKTRG